jgi:hypothetical protein
MIVILLENIIHCIGTIFFIFGKIPFYGLELNGGLEVSELHKLFVGDRIK